jgi:hypothetical protein
MSQTVALTGAHWMYLLGVIAIIITMALRANVVVPAIVATFLVSLAYSGSVIGGLESVFNGSLTAAKELFNIFLVIALMTSLLNALRSLRSDIRMVEPFRRVMVNGHVAYIVLAVITYFISLFFWPTPAVPLVGAILLPAAILAGLPAMGAAVAIAIAGQGMALSSDYVIRVAPGISAKAAGAGVAMNVVADRALVLSLITGAIALVLGYLAVRRTIVLPSPKLLVQWEAGATLAGHAGNPGTFDKAALAQAAPHDALVGDKAIAAELHKVPAAKEKWSKAFALITPLAFLAIILAMILPKFVAGMPEIKGGDAAALVGGTATLLLVVATLACEPRRFLDITAEHIIDGFVFAFKAMGAVLPIAGFFFIGGADTAGSILGVPAGAKAPSLLFELVQAAQGWIPHNHFFVAFGVLIVGMITGVDGSGFAGLPLTGSLSGALGPTTGIDPATLCAVGQMGAVWTGGGTLIAWSSLIAVTGFARVPVLEAVRILFWPVILGLAASTIAAVLIF